MRPSIIRTSENDGAFRPALGFSGAVSVIAASVRAAAAFSPRFPARPTVR
jgi:hypothetical protein